MQNNGTEPNLVEEENTEEQHVPNVEGVNPVPLATQFANLAAQAVSNTANTVAQAASTTADVAIKSAPGATLGAALGGAAVLGGFLVIGLSPIGPIAGGWFAANMGAGLVANSAMAITQSLAMTTTAYYGGAAVGGTVGGYVGYKRSQAGKVDEDSADNKHVLDRDHDHGYEAEAEADVGHEQGLFGDSAGVINEAGVNCEGAAVKGGSEGCGAAVDDCNECDAGNTECFNVVQPGIEQSPTYEAKNTDNRDAPNASESGQPAGTANGGGPDKGDNAKIPVEETPLAGTLLPALGAALVCVALGPVSGAVLVVGMAAARAAPGIVRVTSAEAKTTGYFGFTKFTKRK